MTSVPVMSAGIRSGVNWMRLNVSDKRPRQRADHQRLRQAGHAFQQAMAAAEQRDQHLLDHVVLADDHAGELLLELLAWRRESFDRAVGKLVESASVMRRRYHRVKDDSVRGAGRDKLGSRVTEQRSSGGAAV